VDPKDRIRIPFKRGRPAIDMNAEHRGRGIVYVLLILIAVLAAIYFGLPRG
jgi:hypothetical protein